MSWSPRFSSPTRRPGEPERSWDLPSGCRTSSGGWPGCTRPDRWTGGQAGHLSGEQIVVDIQTVRLSEIDWKCVNKT